MMFDHQRDRRHPQPRDEENATPVARSALVRRAVLLIEQNLSRRLVLGELAAQLCVSERHLERLFRQDLDTTPMQLLRLRRLDHGHWQLLNTAWSLADIAAECGFDDLSRFVRSFRRHFGAPPGQLRREAQTNGAALSRPPVQQRVAALTGDLRE